MNLNKKKQIGKVTKKGEDMTNMEFGNELSGHNKQVQTQLEQMQKNNK